MTVPRTARRVLLASLVVGASLVALGSGPRAGAQPRQTGDDDTEETGDQPTGTGSGDQSDAAPDQEQPTSGRIELVGQTPWVRPGEQLRLQFRVAQAPADAVVQLVVHERLVTRGDFVDTLDGELGGTEKLPPAQALSEVTRGGDGTYDLGLTVGTGAADDGIILPEQGVYPVELLVNDASGNDIARLTTYLLLLPASDEEFPALDVAVLMEVGGPPGLLPDGTVQPDNAMVANINSRITALEQAPGVPLTVAAVPETLDALAGWGPQGAETLGRLRRALGDRTVLSRPYVDLDLDALAAAGLLTQTPPEAVAGAQVLRDRLREPLERTWIAGATVGTAEVEALRDMGVGGVVVPESAIAGLDDQEDGPEGPVPVGPVALPHDGPVAAVSDDTLTSRLLDGQGELGTQRFLAELTTMWLARPAISDRAVVVRIPEDAPVDGIALGRALQALADGGAVRAIGMDQYFGLPPVGGDEPVTAVLAEGDAPPDLRALTRPLENAQRAIGGLAGTLDDSDTIQSLHRSLLIALDTELTMAQRRAYVGRVNDEVAHISDGVNAPPGFTITLTARTGTIPLTIENRTDAPVSVDVMLQSNQLEFPDGAEMTNVLVPAGGVRVDLKVRTRTSGAFPLHVTLTSPDRSVVYDRTTFTIRSTAVSGAGLVLSIGAGAFLLLWWARHWRTARRSRRLVGGDGSGPGPGSGPGSGDGSQGPPPGPDPQMPALSALAGPSPLPPPPMAPRDVPPPPVQPPPPVPPSSGRPGGGVGWPAPPRGTTVRRDQRH